MLDINLRGKKRAGAFDRTEPRATGAAQAHRERLPEDQYAMRILRAGASGYLTKDRTPEELIKALTKLLRGRSTRNSTL